MAPQEFRRSPRWDRGATGYTYDANGYVNTVTNEVSHVTTVNTKNARGQPTQITEILFTEFFTLPLLNSIPRNTYHVLGLDHDCSLSKANGVGP